MARIIALDYGKKRVGVAATDPLQITANGLGTVSSHDIFKFLTEYFNKEQVERVVIGLPKQMNNELSESMQYIEPFVKGYKKRFPNIPIEYVDERFTSVLAQRAILDSGVSKKRRQEKALVDQVSATIILQSYMESKRNNF